MLLLPVAQLTVAVPKRILGRDGSMLVTGSNDSKAPIKVWRLEEHRGPVLEATLTLPRPTFSQAL